METMPLPDVALLAQKSTVCTSSGNTKRIVQCYEYNDFGHIAANGPKKKKICATVRLLAIIFRTVVVQIVHGLLTKHTRQMH
uniref:Putative ovule protein n=1 Tax=Solanum chacoense TaxID=4108 RepID=A0A0V0GNS4_SOLCH